MQNHKMTTKSHFHCSLNSHQDRGSTTLQNCAFHFAIVQSKCILSLQLLSCIVSMVFKFLGKRTNEIDRLKKNAVI